MKNIIILIFLFCSSAYAGQNAVAEMPNKAGGKIILTESPCPNRTSRIAYSTKPDSPTMTGCWAYDELFIHIRWDHDGQISSFPIGDSFTKIKPGTGI